MVERGTGHVRHGDSSPSDEIFTTSHDVRGHECVLLFVIVLDLLARFVAVVTRVWHVFLHVACATFVAGYQMTYRGI